MAFITFSDSKERTSDRRIWNWFSNLVRFESSNDLITSVFKDTSMWWQKKKKKWAYKFTSLLFECGHKNRTYMTISQLHQNIIVEMSIKTMNTGWLSHIVMKSYETTYRLWIFRLRYNQQPESSYDFPQIIFST